MKINEVKDKINASYNTIKKFILSNPDYNETIDNVLHVTDLGYEKLIEVYGIKSGLLSDDSIEFYKIQLKLLHDQLQESRQFNKFFTNQIELKDSESLKNLEEIKNLQLEIHKKDLELHQVKSELEAEKTKSIFKKIFGNRDKGKMG